MPPGVQREERVFESIHAEIEKVLRRLIPFAGDSLRRIFPRPEEPGALFPTSTDYPLFLRSAGKRNAYSPSFTSPGLSTPFRNAFSLGPGLLEWLGFEGKLLGAMKGVEMIWERDSRIKK
jgi:hypothetical protein